ncbi:FadR/GntR family transcriptional regulator [Streptomyces malaysiensis]|uniref:FadR family transcriptional regulator n=1 Tax=Streptomyces malaysiensis subsp. samsunensis TaxID=459658 RepID=A0A9X2M5M4_STRMQ|nr:FadR/GntR family transcriptional regulator [Streptomyces samsunensis]MCQ8835867.1 FadR family transcriptional regulator [Streptomyces samsunensis]
MSADPEWRTVRRVRTHEQVLIQIQERILNGQLRIGDRLPSERELVQVLGVSRNSVREALRVLEAMGIIDAHTGSGRDAGSTVAGRSTDALSNLLRLHMALAQFRLGDLVDVRIELERLAVRQASAEADPAELTQLRSLTEAMTRPGLDHERFHELDSEFHIRLARASHNALAADLMQALRDAVKNEMLAAFARVHDWDAAVASLTAEHLAILTAVEAGQGDEAETLVARHIRAFYDSVGGESPSSD